jgi:hypothetical protein
MRSRVPMSKAFAMLAVLFLVLTGCPPRETAKPKPSPLYILFVDVTLSLADNQQQSIHAVLGNLFTGMPAGSRVVVYPITDDVAGTGRLLAGELPLLDGTTGGKLKVSEAREAMRLLVSNELSALVAKMPSERLHASCITSALQVAADVMRSEAEGAEVEIVFVSDMLEYCEQSIVPARNRPSGREPIRLEKSDIAAEIKLASSVPGTEVLADLRGARVTIIQPPLGYGRRATQVPPHHQLVAFWRAILDRCRDRKEEFNFGTEVPRRLAVATQQASAD